MIAHPFGWTCILPPLIAILLAIVTKRVIPALLAGIFAGALLTTGGDFFQAIADLFEVHLWSTLVIPSKLRVFAFTLAMGAMVGVISRSGGMQGLIQFVSPWANTRKRGQLVTWILGMVIFFDDYANTILLGNTLRPLFDKLKISREKLAYLVDSTAAPVAGLALISTWVAVEIDYVTSGLENLGTIKSSYSGLDLFISSIPYRFYVLGALFFIPLTALMGRDFGPMLRAERRRLAEKSELPAEVSSLKKSSDLSSHLPPEKSRAINAILPIAVTLVVVVLLILQSGTAAWNELHTTAPTPRDIFGKADSSYALFYGSLAGLAVASLMVFLQQILSYEQIITAAGQGAKLMVPALMILWCASTMSRLTGEDSYQEKKSAQPYAFSNHRLYTGDFFKSLLVQETAPLNKASQENRGTDSLITSSPASQLKTAPLKTSQPTSNSLSNFAPSTTARLLPTLVFILAAVVAFSTGTSFGTMGILIPIIVPLAYTLLKLGDGEAGVYEPLLFASLGGVLAGAVFGDHCSPMSDTTILSSQASGCDHIAHVWTQLPYALVVGIVSILFGTLPIGWGVSVWILLPIQAVVLGLLLRFFGSKVETE